MKKTSVAVIGGGPAGSVAALCLRKLGREVTILEKDRFPRYRIGESLLPGTLSILERLGIHEEIRAANFTKKPAATFLWGEGRHPWSFTFQTPKTAPWTFDHAYQVNRDEFDAILLANARRRGAVVHEGRQVTDVELESDGVRVSWKDSAASGRLESGFVIDASGGAGVLAHKRKLRRWDPYFRNMALWSYFKGGTRYAGDLEGNILSVTWKEGWIWLIPLKDDVYSVGVVTDLDASARMKEMGPEAFYRQCLEQCDLAQEVLADAEQCDGIHVLRDWAYDASSLALGRAFLCGDSACFIDPLFSQGVHLATYSAMLAAAAIDYQMDHPESADAVNGWFERSYREAYDRYHKFLAAFYSNVDAPDSTFWSGRRIAGADRRFDGKDWFASMTGQRIESESGDSALLEEHAATLAHLWEHREEGLAEEFDREDLAKRRLQWASGLMRDQKRMKQIYWNGKAVRLLPGFTVHPTSFKLEPKQSLADESGRTSTAFAMTEEHRKLFESLISTPLSYASLFGRLRELKGAGPPAQVIQRLLEADLLAGFDAQGERIRVQGALRFGGVGADDDMS